MCDVTDPGADAHREGEQLPVLEQNKAAIVLQQVGDSTCYEVTKERPTLWLNGEEREKETET